MVLGVVATGAGAAGSAVGAGAGFVMTAGPGVGYIVTAHVSATGSAFVCDPGGGRRRRHDNGPVPSCGTGSTSLAAVDLALVCAPAAVSAAEAET